MLKRDGCSLEWGGKSRDSRKHGQELKDGQTVKVGHSAMGQSPMLCFVKQHLMEFHPVAAQSDAGSTIMGPKYQRDMDSIAHKI
jgi:hypothetical protein